MAETQKQGRPTNRHPDEWQQDLNSDPLAGQNVGLENSGQEKMAPTAYDLKAMHRSLADFSDAELKQINVLPQGTRLKQGATYIDLQDPERKEFTAMGHMEATSENGYVSKTETSYELWNRLTGIDDPNRTLK